MELKALQKQIQAILFASGEPVEGYRLAAALEIDEDTVKKLVDIINDALETATPFVIIRLENSYQIVTQPEFEQVIRKTLESKRNTPLSPAALEVLAIIAYNQPVTKAFIEQVRGVDSSGIVGSLVEKGLAEESGRLELPGRPICYKTAPGFLRCFGLSGLSELPPIPMQKVSEAPSKDE